jgi:hypothetical protein
MCGFIRRCSKFGITLSLIVLSIALCQISSRTDLSSSSTQPNGASGGEESSYPDVLALGKPVEQVLPAGGSRYYKITLNSGQYLRLLISPSGTQLATTLYAPDGQKVSQSTCRQKWTNTRIRNCRGIRDLPIGTPIARRRFGTRAL